MNRLDTLFSSKSEQILNVYFTAGYPSLHDTKDIILGLEAGGADLIEVGIPYSDPLADGTTIQQSSTQALANGMSLEVLFEQLQQVRQETEIPLVLMGYYNQVLQFGESRFIDFCTSAGVDGLILPDLPLAEFQSDMLALCQQADLRVSFLITPQTSEARIRQIDQISDGFIYVVSSSSITGKTRDISPQQIEYFERIEGMNLKNPRLIGFGISDAKSFQTACQYANGAIIGSAFIRALGAGTNAREDAKTFVEKVRSKETILS
ncbi:MAG: tryptophan synthase subunit alpha [Bacteroidota bacterium]